MYGPLMRYAILFSIAVSQLGFVSAYTIFVAENLKVHIFVSFDEARGMTDFHRHLFMRPRIAKSPTLSYFSSSFNWSSFCHWRLSET